MNRQLQAEYQEGFDVGYAEGYAAGKDKAHFEIRNTIDHASGCGCDPCETRRVVIKWVSDRLHRRLAG